MYILQNVQGKYDIHHLQVLGRLQAQRWLIHYIYIYIYI